MASFTIERRVAAPPQTVFDVLGVTKLAIQTPIKGIATESERRAAAHG